MGNNFCERDMEGRDVLGCSPKHPLSSHDQVHVASLTTSWDSRTSEGLDRATKSSTEGNGRPEEADTAHSYGEEGSMRQLETLHPHSPNTKTIPTTKTSADVSDKQTTTLKHTIIPTNHLFVQYMTVQILQHVFSTIEKQ